MLRTLTLLKSSKPHDQYGGADMITITLSVTPRGNGYQGTIRFSHGVSISSAETFPTIAEAMTAAALKLLEMPDRLEALDRIEAEVGP
jgi:hypothetical protein